MADKDKYYIPIEGKLIEVEENVYVAYYKMGRRERYLEERDQVNGVLSYDALDQDGMVGLEMFQDPGVSSLEDLELTKELNDQLHRCIDMLPKAERELIQAIYFDGMSDREYSKRINKTQPTVNARSETAAQKAMFADGMRQRRCLVPAAHYYEWEKTAGKKIKYAIEPN